MKGRLANVVGAAVEASVPALITMGILNLIDAPTWAIVGFGQAVYWAAFRPPQ